MSHETARQRAARHKRDPYRAAQIAPVHVVPPVRCECGHARLMHNMTLDLRCLNFICDCVLYTEAK